MRAPTHPYKGKVGISDFGQGRRKQIEYDLGTPVKVFLMLPIFYAEYFEKRVIHRILKRRRVEMPEHAGQTEWFSAFPNYISIALSLFIVGYFFPKEHTFVWGGLVALIPRPLDHALMILIIALTQYFIIAAVVWGLVKMVI